MAVKWTDAPRSFTRECVFTEVHGDTGTGRTSWALSAPGPIALIHASEKLEGIVQPHRQKGKVIRCVDFGGIYRGSPKQVSDLAVKSWDGLVDAWYDAFSWARTIVLDTHTAAWELIRLARFGMLNPASGRVDSNYGPVNYEWSCMFKHFRHQDSANVILIGETKDEYVVKKGKSAGMGQRTGNTIMAGQREVPFYTDVIVRTTKDIITRKFTSTVEKGWYNAHLADGLSMDNDMSDFPMIMQLITERDCWSE